MRHLILLAALIALPSFARAELTIISAEHRPADSFKRVSEYLTGKPSEGRYTTFRTDDSDRDGFYISLLASDKATLANVSTIRLQFVPPGTQEITTVDFPTTDLKKKRLLVGLTGEDWTNPDTFPLAWKIDLLDSNQTTIDSAQSFLWAKPAF